MRYYRDWYFQFRTTSMVKYLIIFNFGIFIINLLSYQKLFSLFGLIPALFWRGALWQVVTYIFLHSGFFHLLINMLILWMFGTTLESTWGSRKFLKYFFICGVGAGLLNAVITPNSPIPTVGASGSIYGLLMAFGILFPNQLIYFWGIFPIKAKYFVIGIGAIELLAAMSTTQSGIAHFAHLGGMLFGLVYIKWADWNRLLSAQWVNKKRKKHLKVVRDSTREKETLQKIADELLDKINKNGIGSLTAEEHKRLKKVIQKMNELDKEV